MIFNGFLVKNLQVGLRKWTYPVIIKIKAIVGTTKIPRLNVSIRLDFQ